MSYTVADGEYVVSLTNCSGGVATSGDLLYGSISGYTAKLAAFVDHLSLDKGEVRDGYCSGFYCFPLWIAL